MAQVVSKKCTVCGENNSKLLCYECNQELCEICRPIHDKFSANKQHTIVDNRDVTCINYAEKLKCITHDQENRCFCLNCNSLICAECVIDKHKSHDVKSIKTMAYGYRMDLSKTELKVKGEMEILFNLKTCIQKKKKTLSEAFNLIERDLTGSIDDVQNIVKGVADKYLATTKTHLIKQENISDSELQQVEMTENGYKTFIKTLTELKKEKHDGSFVTRFMWLQDDMANLKEMPSVQSEGRLKSFDRSAILSTIANEIILRDHGDMKQQKSQIAKEQTPFATNEDKIEQADFEKLQRENEKLKAKQKVRRIDFKSALRELDIRNMEYAEMSLLIENLEKRNQDLENQIERFLSKDTKFENTESRLKEANDIIQTLKDENDRIQAKYKSFKDLDDRLKDSNDLIQSLTEENERILRVLEVPEEKTKKMVTSLQKKLIEEVKQKDRLLQMCDKYKAAYQKLQITNQTQEERLSKVAGMKMKDNNPSIADLSDPNRREKLSEKFREIYDNAWSNLLDAITEKTGESDDICVKQILSALMMMYDTSKSKITSNKRDMAKLLGYPEDCFDKPNAGGKEVHDPVLKTLKYLIQVSVTRQSVAITKNIKEFPEIKTILQVGGKNGDAFITECLQLCFYMCTQDPHVVLDFSCKSGDPFNKDKFTPFTKFGSVVDYMVWPVMYLSDNGAIMSKGIAQGK